MTGLNSLYRGDDVAYRLTLTNKCTGTPIDLTNCSIYFILKEYLSEDDTNAVL